MNSSVGSFDTRLMTPAVVFLPKVVPDAFDEAGVDVCYEIHPGEDLHDGAPFIRDHIIRVAERCFDDFAASGANSAAVRRLPGLQP